MMTDRSVYGNMFSDGSETVAAGQGPVGTTMPAGTASGPGPVANPRESASWWRERGPRDSNPAPVKSEEWAANRPGQPRRPRERVIGLKKWEGSILEVGDGLVTVELTPFDHEGPELVADFDAYLLGEDADSVAPGDVVYLTTRTVKGSHGHPYRTSSLKLRRPGRWSEQELQAIDAAAKEQAGFFKGIH